MKLEEMKALVKWKAENDRHMGTPEWEQPSEKDFLYVRMVFSHFEELIAVAEAAKHIANMPIQLDEHVILNPEIFTKLKKALKELEDE